jgi:Leu/Phe-tRNA-protein transferase
MENKIACINGGIVQNIIVCDDALAQTLGFDQVVNINEYQGTVQFNMKYENGVFLMPADDTHTDWWNPNIPVTRT